VIYPSDGLDWKLVWVLGSVFMHCIRKTKGVFARYGIPEKVVSDNGPQYSSAEYSNFARAWGFKHETSSPTYAQSNGLAEKYVQISKHLLAKAKRDSKDPYLSLLEHRNTPIDGLASPAQLLMSRRLRSILPATGQQLKPQTVNADMAKKALQHKQQRQKFYYDRNAAPLKPLYTGESVRVQQKDGRWKPAVITGQASTPRAYHLRYGERKRP
jgi:transposase InsO family protein